MLVRSLIVLLLISGSGLAVGAITSNNKDVAASSYVQALRLNTAKGPVDLTVELATDPASQERGLMYRRALGPTQGMLFVFPREALQAFWMKNTFIPLDLIFMDAGRKVVHIANNAQPQDESLIPSIYPAKYVLEVPGGQAALWGLVDGNKGEGNAFERGDSLALQQ